MATKLYGTYYSSATARAIVVMLEKEVDFELISTSILLGEHKKPEYMTLQHDLCTRGYLFFGMLQDTFPLRYSHPPWVGRVLQPFGLVPLLEDEDLKLFESGAIMRYIADKYEAQGTPKLYGSTKAERALVEQWMEVESGTFSALMRTLVKELIYGPGLFKIATDQKAVEDATEKLNKVLDVYEAQLTKHQYLAGDFVSIADLGHLPLSNLYFNVLGKRELLSSRPRVAAWWGAILSRASWKKIVSFAGADYESWVKAAKSFQPQ
nr:glutathione S-transferase F10-like [Physcomitrium patens]|eukprot:XP_024381172.1 glutathione S-transferase F10-like [Physcomitrella patens]